MADQPVQSFEFVGDPMDLPDSFFEVLAVLLLSLEEEVGCDSDAERSCERMEEGS